MSARIRRRNRKIAMLARMEITRSLRARRDIFLPADQRVEIQVRHIARMKALGRSLSKMGLSIRAYEAIVAERRKLRYVS